MRQRRETLRASCNPDSRPMRAFRLLGRFQFLHPLLYPLILTLLSAPLTTPLRADTISGTVKDPSGAVVAGARIEISRSEEHTSELQSHSDLECRLLLEKKNKYQ